MQQVAVIVDNFYEDPGAIRSLALQANYYMGGQTAYLRSKECYWDDRLLEVFSKLLNRRVQIGAKNTYESGNFKVSNSRYEKSKDIHYDTHTDWNAIVYLNLPEQCEGGTSMWRHKATGLEGVPSPEDMQRLGFGTEKDFYKKMVLEDGLVRSNWEEIFRIPMKYNRLVIIPSRLFHSRTSDFGVGASDSRLIHTFFLTDA
ncbi:MAG TPA: DUF6445 family protein [Bdellovibrionota bacterium]|nr:DUF6445 family protein [Bdellovibrionota bacterium]